MANRYTLHKNSLEDFKSWLVADGWEIEKPKGIYEVLRARKAGRQQPLIVYTKSGAKEHLTVMDRDLEIVGAFLRDKKKPQTNADRIRSMTENEAKALKFIENIKDDAVVTLDHIVKEEPNVSPLVYKGREEKANTILAMVEELKRYRAIGTPEECRETVEKQEPFKPETAGLYIGIGRCKCGVEFLDSKTNYCGNCGQKLNWGTETVTEQEDTEARK